MTVNYLSRKTTMLTGTMQTNAEEVVRVAGGWKTRPTAVQGAGMPPMPAGRHHARGAAGHGFEQDLAHRKVATG